jgi:hypothetical protein
VARKQQEVKIQVTFTPGWEARYTEACCKEYIKRKEREALGIVREDKVKS